MTKKILGTAWAVLVAVVAVSCDDFYSSSWGTPREYESSKIVLSQDNLSLWKNKAVGNPALAKALVKKIIAELPGKSGAEKAAFQSAGIDFAIEQSGLGVKILELAGSDLSHIDSDEGVKGLLNKVQNGIGSSGKTAAENIAAIVASSVEISGGIPQFKLSPDLYGQTVDPSEAGLAIMVLALAEIATIQSGSDFDLVASAGLELVGGNQIKITGAETPTRVALAAYLNLIATSGKFDDNMITSGLKSAFKLGNS
jgi:hypothetical protein